MQVPSLLPNLTLHFTRCFERDELPAPVAATTDSSPSPEAKYQAWLSRQYASFLSALHHLLGSPAVPARDQLAALAALMDCAGCNAGGGRFDNELFTRTLWGLLLGRHTQPDVLATLLSKYMGA
jgi:hypothetical protein